MNFHVYYTYVSVMSEDSFLFFFFFKQKTAYEMRISDWSSDVCSSDLPLVTRSRKRRHSSAASLDLSLGENSARTVSCRCGNARTELRVVMRGCITFSIFGRQ